MENIASVRFVIGINKLTFRSNVEIVLYQILNYTKLLNWGESMRVVGRFR